MSSKSKSKAALSQHVQSHLSLVERHNVKPLSEIKDLNGQIRLFQSKSKIKEDSVRGSNAELSTKRAPIRKMDNKQNKEIDDNVLKMISYTNLSRNMEQKNVLIEKQKEEIQVLKQCVNDIKYTHQNKQAEEQRIRKQEISKLKQQQKEYAQNLKDLEQMKGHFKEIKKKYQAVVSQKQTLNEKYLKLLSQNQGLTLVINSLKEELESSSASQKILDFEQEIAHLRQDLRNLETQRESNDIRSTNFQKRMNEYILKYNEVQGVLSQAQIKYYKLQKDCDNLKLDKEEVEQKLIHLNTQTQAQRQMHAEQVILLKGKFKKYEQELLQKDKKVQQLLEKQNKKDSGIPLQEMAKEIKRIQDENVSLRQENALQVKKWQRYVKQLMRHCNQQQQDKLRNCKIQYEEILIKKERQIQSITSLLQKSNLDLKAKDDSIKSYEAEISDLQQQISCQRLQEQKILQKISLLERQINEGNDYLQNQNQILNTQNQKASSKIKQAMKIIEDKEIQLKTLTNRLQSKQSSQMSLMQHLEILNQQNEALQVQKRSIREQQGKEKRYYQQKYEREIEQYNQLSSQFSQLETQYRKLLKSNAENTLQTSNLKAELHLMKEEIDKLLKEDQRSQQLKYRFSDVQRANMDARQKLVLYEKKTKQLDDFLLQLRNELFTVKQVNSKLREQYETACAQKEDLKYKLACQHNYFQSQHTKQYGQLMNLSDQVRLMQEDIYNKNKTIIEKDIIVGRVKQQLEQHVQEIRYLSQNILMAERKYLNLVEKYNDEQIRWEQQKNKWKWQLQCHQNERKVLQHSRMSVDYSLDSSQAVVEILREQNKQLQLILGGEIERRNATIRELINQKKTLFSQLIEK